ncbi:MAG: ABC transporter ATP-binding protein, partial [Acutalibacteraceae bacterium]|nr:ABC transporter ATP-binding protein [Acutalibacteraceae bacterium]
ERILNIADKVIVISGGTVKNIGKKDEILPDLLGTADAGCKVLTEKL